VVLAVPGGACPRARPIPAQAAASVRSVRPVRPVRGWVVPKHKPPWGNGRPWLHSLLLIAQPPQSINRRRPPSEHSSSSHLSHPSTRLSIHPPPTAFHIILSLYTSPPFQPHPTNMRFSAVSVAVLAGAVAAVPQYQPISQISDGQIQAPPAATGGYSAPVVAPVPSVSKAVPSAAVPSVTGPAGSYPSAAVPSAAVPSAAVPTAPVPSAAYPSAAVPTVVVPVPGVNSTAILSKPSVAPSATKPAGTSAGASSTASSGLPQASGAAAGNAISFGGLVIAMAAAVLA